MFHHQQVAVPAEVGAIVVVPVEVEAGVGAPVEVIAAAAEVGATVVAAKVIMTEEDALHIIKETTKEGSSSIIETTQDLSH